MGTETSKALRARRRESAARLQRLIAQADERNPITSARRTRIQDCARVVRRRIKTLAAAERKVAATQVEIGQALLRVVDLGLSRNEAFRVAGLTRHLGRTYIDLALRARGLVPTASSTASAAAEALAPATDHLGHHNTRQGANPREGEI